ncbi:deoxyhypusine synthase family protein [Candidatus Micrarchaeota archaeon]|nr:deoxyhypusine synthase family protein [Candidatus Micrarchaeota archaeon]
MAESIPEKNPAETKRPKLTRFKESLHDGFVDHLQPVHPLDLSKINSVDELVRGMEKTAFAGRNVGEAADTLYTMVKDSECAVVLTVSGAMTIAKMGLVMCEMIDRGMVQAIVSTGALMAHGFVEGAGMTHFKYKPGMKDADMYQIGYNRVYDTIELEKNLDDAEKIMATVLSSMDHRKPTCSREINQALGKHLKETTEGRAILKSAHEKNVPIYIPAFTDSEFGLDFSFYNMDRERRGESRLVFDPFLDLNHFKDFIMEQKRLGIFTIGGGVPRNWAQQVAPYIDLIRFHTAEPERYRLETGSKYDKRYSYGVRICPEPTHWGGLSGCTYSEGVSWGKFLSPKDGGQWTEVYADASIAWPLVVKAVMERLEADEARGHKL